VLLLRVYEIKSNAKRDLILTEYYNNICINKGGAIEGTPLPPPPLSRQNNKKKKMDTPRLTRFSAECRVLPD